MRLRSGFSRKEGIRYKIALLVILPCAPFIMLSDVIRWRYTNWKDNFTDAWKSWWFYFIEG